MHVTDERIAATELDYLADALRPPCGAGPYTLTGYLARSETALLYTARGPDFGSDAEGVLKLTGSGYAPILMRELSLLSQAAAAGLDTLVRPCASELVWLAVGGDQADRPAAAMPLPFLSGGDLASLADRARRSGGLGVPLALQVGRPVGEALRGLLMELSRPVVHGDVRAQNVLLPTPDAEPSQVRLIDLDAALELAPELAPAVAGRGGSLPAAAATSLREDVRGFGEVLHLLVHGHTDGSPAASGNRPFDSLLRRCLADGTDRYLSLADPALWQDLAAAEREAARRAAGGSWLSSLLAHLPGRA